MEAKNYIEQLNLQQHPEGGWYQEIYRSEGTIKADCLSPDFAGARHYCTSIYYLLEKGDFSAFHRIKSDEVWHFYAGGPLLLHLLDETGTYSCILLGNDLEKGATFQAVMLAGVWFAAEPAQRTSFVLSGCTVSPGFDFSDFEMAKKEKLLLQYPAHQALIARLCR